MFIHPPPHHAAGGGQGKNARARQSTGDSSADGSGRGTDDSSGGKTKHPAKKISRTAGGKVISKPQALDGRLAAVATPAGTAAAAASAAKPAAQPRPVPRATVVPGVSYAAAAATAATTTAAWPPVPHAHLLQTPQYLPHLTARAEGTLAALAPVRAPQLRQRQQVPAWPPAIAPAPPRAPFAAPMQQQQQQAMIAAAQAAAGAAAAAAQRVAPHLAVGQAEALYPLPVHLYSYISWGGDATSLLAMKVQMLRIIYNWALPRPTTPTQPQDPDPNTPEGRVGSGKQQTCICSVFLWLVPQAAQGRELVRLASTPSEGRLEWDSSYDYSLVVSAGHKTNRSLVPLTIKAWVSNASRQRPVSIAVQLGELQDRALVAVYRWQFQGMPAGADLGCIRSVPLVRPPEGVATFLQALAIMPR